MILDADAIQEFKELYRQRFGVTLSDDDARSEALKLIEVVGTFQQMEVNNSD